MDQSKKTMRHFYCRDVLWETFEQMANDFDCSIDYLVNEAMRYYARSKNYQAAGGGAPATSPPPSSNPPAPRPQSRTANPPVGSGGGAGVGAGGPRRPPGPTPGYGGGGQPAQQPARAPAPGPGGGRRRRHAVPLVQRAAVSGDQGPVHHRPRLEDRDLAIKDGNISRKHAAVIRRNGTFYIKDLGSTNGIDYKGMRIDNKRIDEGDVFFSATTSCASPTAWTDTAAAAPPPRSPRRRRQGGARAHRRWWYEGAWICAPDSTSRRCAGRSSWPRVMASPA
jgi:hypothetical protein